MKKADKRAAVFLVSGGPSTAAVYFLRNKAAAISKILPECVFYSRTGLLCPACGNTRSVLALLRFDIISSVGYNPAPLIIVTLTAALLIENIAALFDIKLKLIPRGDYFPVLCAGIFLLYCILRNIFPFLTLC
ncbi:MAG: DUF2752 domain-containing protein [Ruminococcus sp.]|nr:DUF2752 domain-containing protein [Ruminococcus sp.]